MYKFILRKLILFWAFMLILSTASSQTSSTNNLLANFQEEVLLSKQTLDQLALKITAHKQWFKNYQSQILSEEIRF